MKTEIINYLKNTSAFVSGQEISDKFHLSRAAIWKNVEELRKEGYTIDAIPRRGYRLSAIPDRIIDREIQSGLNTKVLGKKIYAFDTISSTMEEAFRLGLEGDPEGTLVCADAQTKGKGRMGRSWISPKGKGIYCSLILRPKRTINEIVPLTLLSAVALCEAMIATTGLKPKIKWPNDIFINGKKVAGILTEMNAEMDRVKFLILGIGINVNATPSQIPPTATSLKIESEAPVSRLNLIKELLTQLERQYFLSLDQGMEMVIEAWKIHSLTLGSRVKATVLNQNLEGLAFDIDKQGALLLKKDSGEIVRVLSGDIVEMRPHA